MNTAAAILTTCPLCAGRGTIDDPDDDAPDDKAQITCLLCRGDRRTTLAKIRRMAEEKGMYP